MKGSILIAGSASDAGKSVIVRGFCRWLARNGVKVTPFKAQNMSLNSAVTRDGAEIGRAQAAQAEAAGVPSEAAMNPVLLKPVSDQRAQVILMGHPIDEIDATSYQDLKPRLFQAVRDAYLDLDRRFDVIVCEGAGSPAEINVREGDLVNMGLARIADIPVVIVGDIDRGGVFASLYGSVALLDPRDQALVAGFIINKFRGDPTILEPGLRMIEQLTARRVFGVIPWIRGLWIDAEDSLNVDALQGQLQPPLGSDALRVAVLALRHMSNFTDFDPLACEPGVVVQFTRSYTDLMEADLVVLPGTKATVVDLEDLRRSGLDSALMDRARRDRPILGICGGYQMLGNEILDDVESRTGTVKALGLLPVETRFGAQKILSTPEGVAPDFGNTPVAGYEIRHGRTRRLAGERLIETPSEDEGCVQRNTYGTSWHGIFECDEFRRAFLQRVADLQGRDWKPGSVSFANMRQIQIDLVADTMETTLDMPALLRLIERGNPNMPALKAGVE